MKRSRAEEASHLDILRIDLHTHILPPEIPDLKEKFGYGEYIRLEHIAKNKANMMLGDRFFREIEANCWDCGVREKECDATNVDVQVLSTVPVMFNYHCKPQDTLFISQFLNDHIAACVKANPERFLGLGTVPMQDPELAATELERCVTELGLCGIQIGSRVNDMNLDDRKFDALWEKAEKLGAAIFVHPWDMENKRAPKYWMPWLVGMPAETTTAMCSMIFGGVFERFPKLRVAFAHGGGQFPFTLGRIAKGHSCRPDLVAVDNKTPPREYVGKFWVDSLVHDEKSLRFLLDVMGEDKVCLGSDYPFPLGEDRPGETAISAGLDSKTVENIFCNAPLNFLGIDRETARKRFGK